MTEFPESLTGSVPEEKRLEQCFECKYWYPCEDMVWYQEMGEFACQQCSPIVYVW